MSWYYIDASGTTLGPVEEGIIVQKYKGKELNDDSYVWNGTTVNEWSLIKNVGFLKAKCKPAPPAQSRAPAPRGGRAAAPRPAAGGGKPKKKSTGARMNLLDSIRSGKQLKKVEKKPEPAASSGGGPRMGGRAGGKMSLQDQLKMKLNKRSGPVKKSSGGMKSSGGSVGGGSKPTPSWKKKSTAGSSNTSSGPKKTWGNKNSSSSSAKSSSSGGAKMSKFEMKKAIDNCNDDWILKAISKLLS